MKSTAAVLLPLLCLAAFISVTGINWGLPSRLDDPYLLGRDYHGLHLEALTSQTPEVDAAGGADVVPPEGKPDQFVTLDGTDAERARILCRYRLYSDQPDEMITFRALSQMKPATGDFDPRLYQYGGLWIYGVGALIEAGKGLGLLSIADRATYIGNPKLFGRFYIMARAYSAAWGIVGVWAVYLLTRRLTGGGRLLPALAAFCFLTMPVVINAAHEAKPHLAGTTLILLAVLSADNFVRTGKMRWAWMTGVACGAAAGMVLWAAVAVILVPAMVLLGGGALSRRITALMIGLCVTAAVYGLTNPYVIDHLLFDSTVLRSNLANTSAMYRFSWSLASLCNAAELSWAGMEAGLLVCGLAGSAALLARREGGAAWLLAAVAIPAGVQFVLTAGGKPGEYGRFALLPDTALCIAGIAALRRVPLGWVLGTILALATAVSGAAYHHGFVRDAMDPQSSTRMVTAEKLRKFLQTRMAAYQKIREEGKPAPAQPVIGVYSDPAPYCLPPVDLEYWKIVRLPRGFDAEHGAAVADVIVRPDESVVPWDIRRTPLSWANVPFVVTERSVEDRVAAAESGG